MTSVSSFSKQFEKSSEFLNSISPCIHDLDDNVHYILGEDLDPDEKSNRMVVNWPISKAGSGDLVKARLDETYLNIARPPLNADISLESTTYVYLPYHILRTFERIKQIDVKRASEGGMEIGANINPLLPDPFKLVNFNPGCMTDIIKLDSSEGSNLDLESGSRKTLNKIAKVLKMGFPGSNYDSKEEKYNLLAVEDRSKTIGLVDQILNYDADTYSKELHSPNTSKLIVSCNVNILNVFAIDNSGQYKNTKKVIKEYQSSNVETNSAEATKHVKTIEIPILRLKFHSQVVVTTLKTTTSQEGYPIVIVGLYTGEVVYINLENLHYSILTKMDGHAEINNPFLQSLNSKYLDCSDNAVTSICILKHHLYDILICAGYSNGEVAFFNPYTSKDSKYSNPYTKEVVDKDEYATYFRKFDLSLFNKTRVEQDSLPSLVGHLKVSQKPITSIASTLSHSKFKSHRPQSLPYIVMIASNDGFVKSIDLNFSYNSAYGNSFGTLKSPLITDVFSCYFSSGICDIVFSPDFKYFCVAGNGDLIEVFKLTYYNVSSLIQKSSSVNHLIPNSNSLTGGSNIQQRRSRSNTANSNTSDVNNLALFLSPISSAFSGNTDKSKHEASNESPNLSNDDLHPFMIKDIKVVARLKGHTNSVTKITFVDESVDFQGPFKSNKSTYTLMSAGDDGKVIIWEFDYRGLPKIKPTKHQSSNSNRRSYLSTSPVAKSMSNTHNAPMISKQIASQTPISKNALPLRSNQVAHMRSRSGGFEDYTNFSPLSQSIGNTSMNNISSVFLSLKSKEQDLSPVDSSGRMLSFYKSLFDLRIRKHYTKLISEQKPDSVKFLKFDTVIHPIEDDKKVPCIEIPLLVIDYSLWFPNGKISNFYLELNYLWASSKAGDILRYDIN